MFSSADRLREAGFCGFVTMRELRECRLRCVPGDADDMGVYVVLRLEPNKPVFVEKSSGGLFKGQNPSVPTHVLESNWVHGTPVLYIGKAGAPGRNATLRSRLKQYLDFGAGRPVGHWGGRLIWQLANTDDLVVCWKRTTPHVPREVEGQMIQTFVASYGKRPFANLCN